MAHDPNCIFCKIINGEIPSAKVFENEDVFAFLDISQNTKGHTLVIPKDHQQDIFSLKSETAAKLFSVVPQIAQGIKDTFNPIGMNLLNNNGEFAGQTVFHYHIHILPRYGKGDGFGAVWHSHESDYSEQDRQDMADKIAKAIKA
ncbi:HIT family protein [Scopulibacillus cellulosilyticus]|uniref:HIT family protein n=1 Tax=Scopulibacillus cellulosilyticus TaxID=2665665 RepID=A0ABW2PQJ1_9BACL